MSVEATVAAAARRTLEEWAALCRKAALREPGFPAPELLVDAGAGQPCTENLCRQRAWYDPERHAVSIAPVLLYENKARRMGVLAHELGHALLFWRGIPDHTERGADRCAEEVLGVRISYDPLDLIQSVADGIRPRPRSLG